MKSPAGLRSTKILYADEDKFQKTGETVFAGNAKETKDLYVTRYKNISGQEFSGETFGAKLFDENNQWIGNLGIMRDITEREQAEIRRQQAQKMEAIGTLAGGIAQDFNNILSSIIGFTELALGGIEKGTELEDDLQEVRMAGMRAKDLVKQILTFARQSSEVAKPIQVSVKDTMINRMANSNLQPGDYIEIKTTSI